MAVGSKNSIMIMLINLLPAVWVACLGTLCYAKTIPELSFGKPFQSSSKTGVRTVGGEWLHGGRAEVKTNFVRLTSDLADSYGYVWSKRPIGITQFSVVLSFLISGEKETNFGDGLALWMVQNQNFNSGKFHGHTGLYKGIGIIFNTFYNHEAPDGYRDVSLQFNDETRSEEALLRDRYNGCNVPKLRYHKMNAAYSAHLNGTRVKVQVKESNVKIQIDSTNTGDWTDCYEARIALRPDWASSAMLGISASTSSRTDSHNIIDLTVFSDAEDIGHVEVDSKVKNVANKPADVDSTGMSDHERVNSLKQQFERLQVEFEHQLTDLRDTTQNTIKELEKQESLAEDRIRELEHMVNGKVEQKVVNKLEKFDKVVQQRLDSTVSENLAKSSTWKVPFILLLLVIAGATVFGYKKYQDLRKSHLL